MTISVIVPIYNAEIFLPDFFSALEKNDFLPGDQVILADNGSTDKSFEICEKMVKQRPDLYTHVKYVEKAGSYATRNYAVSKATGEVLVFTDSDTKPYDSWLSSIRSNISHNRVIAGRIELEIRDRSLWELYDTIVHLDSEKNAENASIATANMAVYKNDFYRVGIFEERFSGGDYDWSQRAVKEGLYIHFVKDACVKHPTRKNFSQILKKEQRIAYGEGNHYKALNRSIVALYIKYLLKILKVDTNIKCSIKLCSLGANKLDILEFNRKFMVIRWEQLKYAIYGYQWTDVRKLGLK